MAFEGFELMNLQPGARFRGLRPLVHSALVHRETWRDEAGFRFSEGLCRDFGRFADDDEHSAPRRLFKSGDSRQIQSPSRTPCLRHVRYASLFQLLVRSGLSRDGLLGTGISKAPVSGPRLQDHPGFCPFAGLTNPPSRNERPEHRAKPQSP